MNRDRKGVNGKSHKRDHDDKRKKGISNGKTKESINITLPYSFIPFAKQFHFPYTYERLPKHNELKGFSGSISYTITPKADLYTETRINKDGRYFLSGSSARGLVRSNVEILSASYPEFIDRTQMLYRDITSNKRGRYLKILANKDQQLEDIEREIEVGYLQKQGNEYYVIPAKKFSNGKNFISIKEHILKDWNVLKSSNYLFEGNTLRKMKAVQNEIDELTTIIKKYREFLDSDYKKKIEKLFLREFNFHKKNPKFFSVEKLADLEEELVRKLKTILVGLNHDKFDSNKLSEAYAKRWIQKFKVAKAYLSLKRNNGFKPYRSVVFYKESVHGGIASMSKIKSEEHHLLGCIFNSTNASSKRSHYVAREPDNRKGRILVPQTVIASYNKMKEKMRTNKTNKEIIEHYYDLFNSDNRDSKENRDDHLPVVFYQVASGDNGQTINKIGVTPYFKVPYDYQIDELIGNKEKGRIDYATALFGYVNEETNDGGNASKNVEKEQLQSFKSRVRFGPIDIVGSPIFSKDPVPLLLPSPSASAEAMYLKQDQKKSPTYEKLAGDSQKKPELNGYKYYHVLKDKVNYTPKKDTENIESKRKVLKPQGIQLKGKIYFTNLTKEEIGLLLLGVDVSLFYESDLFRQVFAEEDLNECYDLLGGGKPYGYGKVKIKVDSLNLETRGNDFHSLMLSNEEKKEGTQLKEYINSFIAEMDGTEYFENVHLAYYLQSKKVFKRVEGVEHYDWSDSEKELVGYKNFRLYPPENHVKKQ
jgi:CRISPR-associated protein (TIGR03986 family)